MKIPFHKPYITDDEVNAAAEQLRSGWLTMGKKTIEFETAFKDYIGCGNAVSLNSATAALHLSLKAIGLEKGDEVIIPAMTFAATAEVIRYFDAVPVFADIESDTCLIDVRKVEECITGKTRAVIPVHYGGQPCDMDELLALADTHNLNIIEDAAHALPSLYKGRIIGTIGHLTCFSFYATKTLTTCEGGMVCTEREDWAKRIEILRLHGIDRDAWSRHNSKDTMEYDIAEAGYKYNLTDPASAIGLEQLKKVDMMLKMRKAIADIYNEAFSGIDGINLYKIKPDRESSLHLYPLFIDEEVLGISRDQFIHEMSSRGISLSKHFIPLYKFSYYKKMGYREDSFPACEESANRIVSLPIYPGMNNDEIEYIIDNVLDLTRKKEAV